MIIVYDTTSGVAERIATVKDGVQRGGEDTLKIRGSSEEEILARYDGPYIYAMKVDGESTTKAWQRYEGPRGGEGWKNPVSGEVRYQEDKPDDETRLPTAEELVEAETSLEVDHDEVEVGDEYLVPTEDDVHRVTITETGAASMFGDALYASVSWSEDDQLILPDVPLYPTDEPAAALFDFLGPERYEALRDTLTAERHESFENPPRGYESVGFDDMYAGPNTASERDMFVVEPDGTKHKITSVFDSGRIDVETADGEKSLDASELERKGAFALQETALGPEELKSEERLAVAVKLGRGGAPKDANGQVYSNWEMWGEVLDEATDEELAEALVLSSITVKKDPGITGEYWDSYGRELNSFMGNEVKIREPPRLDPGVSSLADEDLGPITSRMSKEALLGAVEKAMDIINEKDDDNARRKSKRLLKAAFLWTSEPGVREEIAQEYDKQEWLEGGLLGADSKESFKQRFIDGWHYWAGSDTAFFVQHVLADLGPNKDNPSAAWTNGNSVKGVHIPEDTKRYARELYEETQAKLADEPKTLYRGVRGPMTTHGNLESWSELKYIAKEFAGDENVRTDLGQVLTAEVDPEDVFCTWETLGDEWPEEEVKGKKEWMVLGGGLA